MVVNNEDNEFYREYYRLKFKIQLLKLFNIAEDFEDEELKQATSKILKEEFGINMEAKE